jgi:two-component system response regulator DegU
VLVVDDHDLFRTELRALLEEEGFKVAAAPSGEAALVALPTFQPDVIAMDLNLPRMSGIEATRRVL